jgi:hypothetical protein
MGAWAIQLLTGNHCNAREGVDFDYFTFPVIWFLLMRNPGYLAMPFPTNRG